MSVQSINSQQSTDLVQRLLLGSGVAIGELSLLAIETKIRPDAARTWVHLAPACERVAGLYGFAMQNFTQSSSWGLYQHCTIMREACRVVSMEGRNPFVQTPDTISGIISALGALILMVNGGNVENERIVRLEGMVQMLLYRTSESERQQMILRQRVDELEEVNREQRQRSNRVPMGEQGLAPL